MRVAVIGVGLIGGSIALAARQRTGATVAGFDHAESALALAEERGALDVAGASLAEAIEGAEITFVAVPVGALPGVVADVLRSAADDCIVTDVGSTKRAVVAAHAHEHRFVGGHPLAGAETAGIEHARADLFDAATWYLTPTENTSGVLYERLYRLLRGLGARPEAIDAETHDTILATVSHLPHVFANVLVSQAARTLGDGDERMPGTGPSFRDAIRVAGAPSGIWTDIYLSNRDALIARIDDTIERLNGVRAALRAGDAAAITAWNEAAAADRRSVRDSQLGGEPLYELRASVPNRPGVVAQLALELGRAGVNIADMALYPAADMTEGVVALWISGSVAAQRTQELVAALGYPVAPA